MRTTTLAIVAALLLRARDCDGRDHAVPAYHGGQKMKIEEARKGFARLRARYTLTPDQAKELDHSVATGREVGAGGSTTLRECDGIGLRYFNDLIVRMAGGG